MVTNIPSRRSTIVHRDHAFPAESQSFTVTMHSHAAEGQLRLTGRSLDTTYAITQTSLVSLRLLVREWWHYLTNWESKSIMIFNIHGGNPFPAEVRLLYRCMVNRSSWRWSPSGRYVTVCESFPVTTHPQGTRSTMHGWSIVHRHHAFPCSGSSSIYAWSIVHPDDAFPA